MFPSISSSFLLLRKVVVFARPGTALVLVLLGWTGPAYAVQPQTDLVAIPPKVEAALDASMRNDAAKCRSDDCAALRIILRTEDVFTDSRMNGNEDGTGPTAMKEAVAAVIASPVRIRQRLGRSLLSHARLYPALCRRITNSASLYGVNDPYPDDGLMRDMLQDAMLMDQRDHGHCLPAVLTSLPRTTASRQLIDESRNFCTTSQWGSVACQRIAR